jgi:O-antigen/teichoic acid export membrane protein
MTAPKPPFRIGRDTLLTFGTEGLALLGMVLAFRLAALASKQDLDLYVIARRTVAFLFPVVLMGAMVGLTRFVAMSGTPEAARRYLRGALAVVAPLGVLVCVVCFALREPLAWILFDDHARAGLVPPLGVMTFGMAAHGVAYGYLRGRGRIVLANALQLVVLAIGPCVAFVLFDDMEWILMATGISWLVPPLLAIAPELLRPDGSMRRERAELLRYGLPRVPGDVALGALLTVPGYIALRTYGLGLSGEVGFGATLLNIAAAAFSPVALLLLPAAATKLAKGEYADLAQRVGRMSMLVLLASIALTVGFEALASPLLLIYLGPTGESYITISRIIFLGALPFAYFNGMRSLLDAYFRTPRNGINLSKAFVILLVGGAIHLLVPTPWYTMPLALLVALTYLGLATWGDARYVQAELQRLAAQPMGVLRAIVVVPEAEGGQVYAPAREEAAHLSAFGAHVSLLHLESRTSPLRLWVARQRLKRLIARERPDVVLSLYGSAAGLFTVLSSSVPVVVTFVGDDVHRNGVRGFARPWLGRLFSQLAAFFAAGLICRNAEVRDGLWWRASEAVVVQEHMGPRDAAQLTLTHLRSVAMHKPADS